MHNYRNY